MVMGMLVFQVRADEVEELQKQIDELSKLRQMSEEATKPLESELNTVRTRIEGVKYQLVEADNKTKELEQSILKREDDLAESYQYLSVRVRSYYKLSRQFSPLMTFLAASSATGLTRELSYRAAATDQDREAIVTTTKDILALEEDKASLEQRKVQLASLRGEFEKNAVFFEGEIQGAKDYQEELAQKIAELSAKQKEILAAKSGTFQTTVGEVPGADDPASRADFNPGFSPALAVFSFGAPHYKGMSQYGAYGRAKSGQSADEILKAYYGGGIEIKKDYATDITINVDGHGPVDIETYTKRIYEMPASWGDKGGMEALKAQAVAARSYALARTDNGASSICATEACQVYKPANKGGKWDEAVEATKGWVLLAGGKPFSAMYASTSGGYQESYSYNGHTTPGFWDTPKGREGWTSEAYEKVAESPWFYKAWYKSRQGDACGRSHPWLTPEEMADVLNAYVVIQKHGVSDERVISQGGCWGGNPYSIGELRDKANSLSGGYSKVTGVSVSYGTNGTTAQVTLQTDKGSVPLSGEEFRKAFNLRAPGRVAIKSGLFNVEVK
jgi:peptidoglycan hydrolase CwlO-like protein